ncbi:hypothetical protein [Nocardia beijingensis]|uniref:Uncharacterized protein n=1 Tax=Nocardia beijingensis TaxID=95162 RepID=A0ABW7WSH0_9NOCA
MKKPIIRDSHGRFDREDIDAVVHIRSRRRCQLERRGADPVAVALHLLAETGDVPGWDAGMDSYGPEAA